jgi:hypothetical protein
MTSIGQRTPEKRAADIDPDRKTRPDHWHRPLTKGLMAKNFRAPFEKAFAIAQPAPISD